MNHTLLLLLLTFIESFATICVERGIYFFSHERLGFRDTDNLWLALAFGAAYVCGALSSHRLCRRFGERRLLLMTICGQLLLHVSLAALSVPWAVYAFSMLLGFLNGAKWPVVESYISAGKAPSHQARAIGRFNVSWALSVPLALVTVGPLVEHWPAGLFLVPACVNLVALGLVWPLVRRPLHLLATSEHRPSQQQIARLEALLTSNRWLMLASYSTLFLLAPLLPRVLSDLKVSAALSPGLSGLMDVMRLMAFIILGVWTGWHGKLWPVMASMLIMPISLFMTLFGGHLGIVLAGEVAFGLSAGLVYYASLYYAMVVVNASVEGGGAHEGLIGLGFALGPAAGLASVWLQPVLHSELLGAAVGIGPLLAACTVGACLPLWRARRLLGRKAGT